MEKQVDKKVSEYLSKIGRRGGKKSRRVLSPEQARLMVKVRQARRLFAKYHTQCFWSFDPEYKVTPDDLPWVAQQLRKNGNRELWKIGRSLCP